MPNQFHIKNGPILTVDDKPFASGGEGDLYKILSPIDFTNRVVKIYKTEKQTIDRERKIEYLANNSPELENSNGHHSIIWVDKLVFQLGKFRGFTMPLAQGIKLELLCSSIFPSHLGTEWKKFDFNLPKSNDLRQKICFNIAVAVNQVHALDSYVLIDMKPENIMIQANGLISIIDTDSIEILHGGQVIHAAPVVTPEYTPPEYYRGVKPEKNGVPESWDRFSIAVIFYRILCGIHPFVGSCSPPFDNCTSYDLKIENGLFPNGKNRPRFKVIPKEHSNFQKLDSRIQQLFIRCFDDGHSSPNLRPTVEEWCRELLPDSEVQSVRLLPSAVNKFPTYKYSLEIPFYAKETILLPDFSSPKVPEVSFFLNLINRVRGKSEREKLQELIKKQNAKVKALISKKQYYEGQIEQVILGYFQSQKAILENERKQIDQLKKQFDDILKRIDTSLKFFLVEERKEYQTLRSNSSLYINHINNQIALLQSNLLEQKTNEFNTQRSNHQSLISNLESRKATDIALATKSPNKLSKYSIAPLAKEIFNGSVPQVIIGLQRAGIFTAADFISISSSGELKRQNGTWIKIPGLGATRASLLENWKKTIDKKEDVIIINAIIAKCESDIRDASSKFYFYEKNWQNQINPIKQQFEQEKEKLQEKIRILQTEYKKRQDDIKSKFDGIFSTSDFEAKKIIKDFEGRQNDLRNLTQKNLKDNHSYFSKDFFIKKEEAKAFLIEFDLECKDLLRVYPENSPEAFHNIIAHTKCSSAR